MSDAVQHFYDRDDEADGHGKSTMWDSLRAGRQANYDSLTGLPNRKLFADRMEHALSHAAREQKQIALLYLDIDHFKHVNDMFGRGAGDKLLQSVASRLKHCMHHGDTVARLSGDEFAMLLVNPVGIDGVVQVLDKIIASFRPRFQIGMHELSSSISIGVSTFPRDGVKVEDMLRCADIAMYRTKTAGGKGYSFYCSKQEYHAVGAATRGKPPVAERSGAPVNM
jgi:diguanylate cyclase (GGDEF)-like protein